MRRAPRRTDRRRLTAKQKERAPWISAAPFFCVSCVPGKVGAGSEPQRHAVLAGVAAARQQAALVVDHDRLAAADRVPGRFDNMAFSHMPIPTWKPARYYRRLDLQQFHIFYYY